MSAIVSLSQVAKSYGPKELFTNLNLSIHEGEKVAIIGRNGCGKSTLLKLIAGLEKEDGGQITYKKGSTISYVPQLPHFPKTLSVEQVIQNKLKQSNLSEEDQLLELSLILPICGFTDYNQKVSTLSGGWLKRLSIAEAICIKPDLLLLDEPTNHMDWDTIEWLEGFLLQYEGSYATISHDRSFLNKSTNRTVEIGPAFENNHISYDVGYDEFLEKRLEYFEAQEKLASTLSNKAKRELAWLRAGVKARTTKSRSRIKEAHQLFEKLENTQSRVQSQKHNLKLSVEKGELKAKVLIKAESISKAYDSNSLFSDLDLTLSPKMRLAILGDNGSGKTTLVNILLKKMPPDSGNVFHADGLQHLYFDQHKQKLDLEKTIFEYLGEGSDHVIFKEEFVHVASYANKFLFFTDHFHLKIEQLSGGEKARLQIAKLLLNKCDVLVLDEPTNDLDIDTLDILEDTLSQLNIGIILISHDRSFIQGVCTHFLALEGNGRCHFYADLNQWLKARNKKDTPVKTKKISEKRIKPRKLSYNEKRELDAMESIILEKEGLVEELNSVLLDSKNQSNANLLHDTSIQISQLQTEIQNLYDRWQELEQIKELAKS